VMLQQTQVERVRPYYDAWLERWPTLQSLAQASSADVLRAWSGLGYNRRALNLWRAACGAAPALPNDVAGLTRLPGVGLYTARAVASFACAEPVAVVETNVGRVIARAFHGVSSARETPPAAIVATAEQLLPRDGERARHHNLALMALGAMLCRAAQPECEACPLRRTCAWRRAGKPATRAVAAPAPRFETTARFARGRIVEALRGAALLSAAELSARLPPVHAAEIAVYLAALERDGLVEDAGGLWRLGQSQGSKSMASPKL